MKLVHGKVVGGRIEVEGEALQEGSSVTILTHDDDGLELTPAQEAELARRIEEIEAGEFEEGDALLDELARD